MTPIAPMISGLRSKVPLTARDPAPAVPHSSRPGSHRARVARRRSAPEPDRSPDAPSLAALAAPGPPSDVRYARARGRPRRRARPSGRRRWRARRRGGPYRSPYRRPGGGAASTRSPCGDAVGHSGVVRDQPSRPEADQGDRNRIGADHVEAALQRLRSRPIGYNMSDPFPTRWRALRLRFERVEVVCASQLACVGSVARPRPPSAPAVIAVGHRNRSLIQAWSSRSERIVRFGVRRRRVIRLLPNSASAPPIAEHENADDQRRRPYRQRREPEHRAASSTQPAAERDQRPRPERGRALAGPAQFLLQLGLEQRQLLADQLDGLAGDVRQQRARASARLSPAVRSLPDHPGRPPWRLLPDPLLPYPARAPDGTARADAAGVTAASRRRRRRTCPCRLPCRLACVRSARRQQEPAGDETDAHRRGHERHRPAPGEIFDIAGQLAPRAVPHRVGEIRRSDRRPGSRTRTSALAPPTSNDSAERLSASPTATI